MSLYARPQHRPDQQPSVTAPLAARSALREHIHRQSHIACAGLELVYTGSSLQHLGKPGPSSKHSLCAATLQQSAQAAIIAAATYAAWLRSAAQPQKVRVAVFGGAFDPPTVDHVRCCAQILRSRRVDEVC